jgi:hypothetical protein
MAAHSAVNSSQSLAALARGVHNLGEREPQVSFARACPPTILRPAIRPQGARAGVDARSLYRDGDAVAE